MTRRRFRKPGIPPHEGDDHDRESAGQSTPKEQHRVLNEIVGQRAGTPLRNDALLQERRGRFDERLVGGCGCFQKPRQLFLRVFHIRCSIVRRSNDFFNFCRARKARTLIIGIPQPVTCCTSRNERPSMCSKRTTSRSLCGNVPSSLSTISREVRLWNGSRSDFVDASVSMTCCSSSDKSAQRNSGRTRSAFNWFRQVFTAMRLTQCSSGTLPEY